MSRSRKISDEWGTKFGFHDEIERLKEYIYESLPMVPLELKEKHGIYVHNWKIELKDEHETAVQNRDTQAS